MKRKPKQRPTSARGDRTHKVTLDEMTEALKFRKFHHFWNPAMTPAGPLCGTEPHKITADWAQVDCKRCLDVRRARSAPKNPDRKGG